MSRIYFEYTKNVLLEYPDYFMFALFVGVSFIFVSIRDVLINLPKDSFPNAFRFLVAAVRETSWFLQALIAGFAIRASVSGFKLTSRNLKYINPTWLLSRLRY